MAWISLLLAGVCEAAWAIGLKRSNGFTVLAPSLYTLAAMGMSIWLLAVAMREIPTAVAYATWTAIGTLLVFAFGVLSGQQAISLLQTISMLGLIACVLGLKFG
ncbi:multidrug efflux SMR transporter [Crenobacter sp. SG2305]|uniref:DMT family transporter n=1 Tax=Crenobacter oryzisoli TaxID=3056844 RepID=UPI0025AB4A6C|nr:multidrug efflux SMR transporter [Crenobacter sp. SG2305]MDN0085767.1 multidrug efflux SMR transporter [Crenobacter sp. SG2305]